MVGRFIGTVRRVIIRPTAFFAEVPRRGGFLEPLLFALVCFEISVVLGWLLRLVLLGLGVGIDQWPTQLIFFGTTVERSQDLAQSSGQLLGGSEPSRLVVDLVNSLILGGISLFIRAGVLHLLVRLVVGAENSGFEASFRVLSYSDAVALAGWIPIVGPWLFGLYGIYLRVVGIREVHETTTGRAIGIAILQAVLALLLFGLILPILGLVLGLLMARVMAGR